MDKEEFPIQIGIVDRDYVLSIGGLRIGFIKSLKFEADVANGVSIQIKRFKDAPEHCWEPSLDEILKLHVANYSIELVER